MAIIEDIYNREFKTLRVSLLQKCNLSCRYCTMGEDEARENNQVNSAAPVHVLFQTIQRLHTLLHLETVRLTGGEPLLYGGLIPLIEGIHKIGITKIKLTTNGFLLDRLATSLQQAGLHSINVSLDAIDETVFNIMSRRNGVQRILDGIDTALAAGLGVKINTVLMKDINENQILPLLDFAFKRKIPIRFLEIMAMGHLHDTARQHLFTQDEILEVISRKYTFSKKKRKHAATANYWQTAEGFSFGIIANESEPFCKDCDRLRLDSHGNIYGCLSNNHPIPLNNEEDEHILIDKLQQAMKQKQLIKFVGSELSMLQIGG